MMKIENYIKIASYTQKRIADYRACVQRLCQRIEIDFEQWNALMFETGCIWAENNMATPEIKEKMLTESKYGYWNWWLCIYLEHDYHIFQEDVIHSLHSYQNDKKRFSSLRYDEIQKETKPRTSKPLVSDAQ